MNPCAEGTPLTDQAGERVLCSSGRLTDCPSNYYCHIGSSSSTTLCCPRLGYFFSFFRLRPNKICKDFLLKHMIRFKFWKVNGTILLGINKGQLNLQVEIHASRCSQLGMAARRSHDGLTMWAAKCVLNLVMVVWVATKITSSPRNIAKNPVKVSSTTFCCKRAAAPSLCCFWPLNPLPPISS